MISQQLGFTVLSAPVALCDRRALSEAWFSALHLHKDRTQPSQGAGAVSPGRNHAGDQQQCSVALLRDCPHSTVPQKMWHALGNTNAALSIERRLNRSKLARKIEQVFVRPENRPRQASFALEGHRGRVQILLRNVGASTQIVALCPPAAREVVAQALAQARYALSMRGIHLLTDVRGFAQ